MWTCYSYIFGKNSLVGPFLLQVYCWFKFCYPSRLVTIPRLKSPVCPISLIVRGMIVGFIPFLKIILWGSLNKFPDFFVWALLLIVHTWNSSSLQSNLLRLQYIYCTIPTTSVRPHGSPLVWACQWPLSQPLSSPQSSHNDSL